MIITTHKYSLRASLVLCALTSPLALWAEDIDSLERHVGLEELRVTATKRSLLSRELPSSVSVLSRQLLEQSQFQGIKDLNATVPNVYIPDFGSSLSTPIFIRGIGSRRINMIGMYSDGVPLLEGGSLDTDYSDVRSVEILRGPQGTLYGRGAMGGIINVTSYRPLDYQATHINLLAGTYGLAGINAQSYQTLNQHWGVSAAANYLHKGGYFTNIHNNKKADDSNLYSTKLGLQYRRNGWDIYGFAQYQRRKQGGYPYALVSADDQLSPVNYDQPSGYERDLLTTALNVQKQWANGIILRSGTSYQHLKDEMRLDQDFTPARSIYAKQNTRKNIWTQEFNISRTKARYSWVAGIYGFYIGSDKYLDNDINIPGRNVSQVLISYGEPSYGAALYHQSTYKITDRLTAEFGLRYDWEHSKQEYISRTTNHLRGGAVSTVEQPASTIDRQFTPKLAISYRIGQEHRIYASALRGYQPSGFNVQFDKPEEQSYKPEYSWNYELGTHLFFAGGKLQIDAAAFYIDWQQQQVQQAIASLLGSKMTNAGKSQSLGAELSIAYRPSEALRVGASYGYTHAKFVDYDEFVAGRGNISRKDNYIPQVPKHTVALQAEYKLTLGWSWLESLKLSGQYRGIGDIYWDTANLQKQSFYSLLDAQIGFQYKSFGLELWGKNLLGTDYRTYQFSSQGRNLAQSGAPRHFGLSARVKF